MVNQTPQFGNPVAPAAVRRSKYLEDAIKGIQQGRDKSVYNTAFGTNASILGDAILAFSKRDADNKADEAVKADRAKIGDMIQGMFPGQGGVAQKQLGEDAPFDLTPQAATARNQEGNIGNMAAMAFGVTGDPMTAINLGLGQQRQALEDRRYTDERNYGRGRDAVADYRDERNFGRGVLESDRAYQTGVDQFDQTMDLNRDQFEEGKRQFGETMKFNNLKLALDDAASRGVNPEAIKLEREFAKDWKGVHTNFKDIDGQINRMESMYDLAQRDPAKAAAADLALVVSFTKMLDPGSVAREGEVALTQKAASVLDQAGNWINQLQNGQTLLPKSARDQLIEAAREMYGVYDKAYQDIGKDYLATAQQYGFAPERVMMGYRPPPPSASQSQGTALGGSATSGVGRAAQAAASRAPAAAVAPGGDLSGLSTEELEQMLAQMGER